MGRLFDYDNAVMRFLGKMADVMYLSALWIFCSIPIFTIGASTTALYYAFNKSVRHNRGYAWKEFFSSFKSNFKQSTIIWLITLGLYVLTVVDCILARQLIAMMSFAKVIYVILLVLVVFETMWVIYLFPYVARFGNTTKAVMKNCALIAIANLPRTILLFIIFVVALIAVLFIPLGILFVPGLYMLIANRILEKVFRKYMTPEDLKAEDMRNCDYVEDHYYDNIDENFNTEEFDKEAEEEFIPKSEENNQ